MPTTNNSTKHLQRAYVTSNARGLFAVAGNRSKRNTTNSSQFTVNYMATWSVGSEFFEFSWQFRDTTQTYTPTPPLTITSVHWSHVVSPSFTTDLNLPQFTSKRKIRASLRTERKEALRTTYKTDRWIISTGSLLYLATTISHYSPPFLLACGRTAVLCCLRQHDTWANSEW